jgi:hypothetical protein
LMVIESHLELYFFANIPTSYQSIAPMPPPFKYSTLRRLFPRNAIPSGNRYSQRRWARVHDVRYLATHNTHDRILDKYKDKLGKKAKE